MIENSSPNIPLKKEIAEAQEHARNNVSILEAESGRLERLISTQKRELVAQEGAKLDVERALAQVQDNLIDAKEQFDSVEKSRNALLVEIDTKNKEIAQKTKEIDEKEAKLNEKERELTQLSEKLNDKEKALSTEKSQFTAEKESFSKKIIVLNAALKDIT